MFAAAGLYPTVSPLVVDGDVTIVVAVMLANSFSGWERLLRVDFAQGAREPLDVRGGDGLNAVDGDPFGGFVQGNITENPIAIFRAAAAENYRLARGSACINAGVDLSAARGSG